MYSPHVHLLHTARLVWDCKHLKHVYYRKQIIAIIKKQNHILYQNHNESRTMHIVLNINLVMSIYAGMVVLKIKLKFNDPIVYMCLTYLQMWIKLFKK